MIALRGEVSKKIYGICYTGVQKWDFYPAGEAHLAKQEP